MAFKVEREETRKPDFQPQDTNYVRVDGVGQSFTRVVDFRDDTGGTIDGTADQFKHFRDGEGAIECWVYFHEVPDGEDRSNRQMIVTCKGGWSSNDVDLMLFLREDPKRLHHHITDGYFTYARTTLSHIEIKPYRWYHICVILGGENRGLYLDGNLEGTWDDFNGDDSPDWEYDFRVMRSHEDYDRHTNGRIYDLRFWDYNISGPTPYDIPSSDTPGLVGHWMFDEDAGEGVVEDKTGNGNDIFLKAGSSWRHWRDGYRYESCHHDNFHTRSELGANYVAWGDNTDGWGISADKHLIYENPTESYNYCAYVGFGSTTDMMITCRFRLNGDATWGGIVLRCDPFNENRGYHVDINKSYYRIRTGDWDGDGDVMVDSDLENDVWYYLVIKIVGYTVLIYVDQELVWAKEDHDQSYSSGYPGFIGTYYDDSYEWDNIHFYQIGTSYAELPDISLHQLGSYVDSNILWTARDYGIKSEASGEYVDTPWNEEPDVFTFSAWVKSYYDSSDDHEHVFIAATDQTYDGGDSWALRLRLSDGEEGQNVSFGLVGNEQRCGTVKADEWFHIIIEYDGQYQRTFLNGRLAAESDRGSLTLNNAHSLKLLGMNSNFQGEMAEIQLFSWAPLHPYNRHQLMHGWLTGEWSVRELYYPCVRYTMVLWDMTPHERHGNFEGNADYCEGIAPNSVKAAIHDGSSWGGYQSCTYGGEIPQLSEGDDLTDHKVRFAVHIGSDILGIEPVTDWVEIEIEGDRLMSAELPIDLQRVHDSNAESSTAEDVNIDAQYAYAPTDVATTATQTLNIIGDLAALTTTQTADLFLDSIAIADDPRLYEQTILTLSTQYAYRPIDTERAASFAFQLVDEKTMSFDQQHDYLIDLSIDSEHIRLQDSAILELEATDTVHPLTTHAEQDLTLSRTYDVNTRTSPVQATLSISIVGEHQPVLVASDIEYSIDLDHVIHPFYPYAAVNLYTWSVTTYSVDVIGEWDYIARAADAWTTVAKSEDLWDNIDLSSGDWSKPTRAITVWSKSDRKKNSWDKP